MKRGTDSSCRSPRILFVLVYLLSASSFSVCLRGQDEQAVFRIESNVVLVDLIVTDRSGQFVRDLRPEEFEILEDGKRKDVIFFQRISSGCGSPPPGNSPPTSAKRNGDVLRQVANPIIFVLDLNSIDGKTLQPVSRSIQRFLSKEHSPSARYMLLTIKESLEIRSPMSSDPESVSLALGSVAVTRPRLSYQWLIERIARIYRIAPYQPQAAMDQALSEGRAFLRDLHTRISLTSAGLSEVADYVGALPGRKTLLFYSAGFPINAGPTVFEILKHYSHGAVPMHVISAKLGSALTQNPLDKISEAVKRINDRQSSVYSVDARGLITATLASSSEAEAIPAQLISRMNTEDVTAPQRYLSLVSERTGGLVYLNQNDLDTGAENAFRDSCEYYILGFVPENKDQKRHETFVNLKVRIERPDMRPRHRSGYFIHNRDPKSEGLLKSAFQFPGYYQDFEMDASTHLEGKLLTVKVQVPLKALSLQKDGDNYSGGVSLFGGLVNEDGEWFTNGQKYTFAREFPLKLDADRFNSLSPETTITASVNSEIPAGRYDLILVVYQKTGSQIATFQQSLHIK